MNKTTNHNTHFSVADCSTETIASELLLRVLEQMGTHRRTPHTHELALGSIIFHYRHQNLTVGQLAKLCNTSASTLKRTFVKHYGQSPHRYILSMRLEMVRSMLVSSPEQVKAISFKCGFSSPSHLIRLFKQHYGTTPEAYRKHIRELGE